MATYLDLQDTQALDDKISKMDEERFGEFADKYAEQGIGGTVGLGELESLEDILAELEGGANFDAPPGTDEFDDFDEH